MDGQRSAIAALAAGAIIVADDKQPNGESGAVDRSSEIETGTETGARPEPVALDPTAAFGTDPEPRAASDVGPGLEIDDASGLVGAGAGARPRGGASPNYDHAAAAAKRSETARTRKAAAGSDLRFFESILGGIHTGLAVAFQNDAWLLTDEEKEKLARATHELQSFYGATIDPKTQAWLNFGGAFAEVYAPRVMAPIMARVMARRVKAEVEKEQGERVAEYGKRVDEFTQHSPAEETPAPAKSTERVQRGGPVTDYVLPSQMFGPGHRRG